MNKKRLPIILVVVIICASVLSYSYYAGILITPSISYSPSETESSPSHLLTTSQPELRVFIAASLTEAIKNVTQVFEEVNNCKIILNSAGSNNLYQQIISGSPCDVFMSADSKWIKQLNDAGFLYDNNYYNFTTNTLILMMPKDNPKNITSLLDLAKPGVRLVLAAPAVPAGSYANKTLAKIDQTWGNVTSPQYKGLEWQNYYSNVIANVVSYENTIEDVVSKVALNLGTVDAGIAFVSDASTQGENLAYIEIPMEVNTRGTYGIAVIKSTTQPSLAIKFMNFWLSSEGQNLLNAYGFGT